MRFVLTTSFGERIIRKIPSEKRWNYIEGDSVYSLFFPWKDFFMRKPKKKNTTELNYIDCFKINWFVVITAIILSCFQNLFFIVYYKGVQTVFNFIFDYIQFLLANDIWNNLQQKIKNTKKIYLKIPCYVFELQVYYYYFS